MKPLSILLPVLLVLLVLNVSLGSIHIPVGEIVRILSGQEPSEAAWKDIILDFRLTKALTCILAGGGLAVSGLQMQTLFRNALAGPDVLGLSAGASLAVALVFLSRSIGLNIHMAPNPWIVVIAASAGALCVFAIMVTVARKLTDNVSLLIIGLMIGAAASSLVSVMQYTSNAEELQTYVMWTFGSLGKLGWQEIQILTIMLVLGTGYSAATVESAQCVAARRTLCPEPRYQHPDYATARYSFCLYSDRRRNGFLRTDCLCGAGCTTPGKAGR